MNTQVKNECILLQQKRFVTFLCAIILFYVAAVLLVVPVLTFVIPLETEISFSEMLAFRIISFIAAFLLGIPILAMSISLFIRLRHKFVIIADNTGIYDYSGIFPLGFIAWERIKSLKDIKAKTLIVELKSSYYNNLNLFEKIKSFINGSVRSRGKTLFISFSLCKGKSVDNAKDIMNLWKNYNLK